MQSYGNDEILLMGWLMQFALNVILIISKSLVSNGNISWKMFSQPMFSKIYIQLALPNFIKSINKFTELYITSVCGVI